MMRIEHVLAVVPVADIERADAWYEALFGRPADNRTMPTLVEWQVTGAGWVQVTLDTERAGSGLLNFAVDDLAATRDELRTRGVHSRGKPLLAMPLVGARQGGAATIKGEIVERVSKRRIERRRNSTWTS